MYVDIAPTSVQTLGGITYANFEVPTHEDTLDQFVTRTLIRLGIRASYRGFDYMKDAILHIVENPYDSITKHVYPEIAKKYNTTYCAVERAIRVALERMPYGTFRSAIFENDNSHYTNKEFIFHIAKFVYMNK